MSLFYSFRRFNTVLSNPKKLYVLNKFSGGFNLKVLLVFMLILSSALANIAQGDSNEPNYVKWSQPPVEWQQPNTYIGWDEPSFLDEAYYARWIMVGGPDCWTYHCPCQCYGDADCLREGNPFAGYYYVGTNDLYIFNNCITYPLPVPPDDGCSCADFDRDGDLDDDDAAILTTWYKVQDVPCDCHQLFGPVLAFDDFPRDSNMLVIAIRWWGSFNNWRDNAIPAGNLPYAFHITIWTDVPAGTDANYSHPGKIVWENYCDTYDVSFFGTEFDPRIQQTDLTKFEFYQELAPNDYWYLPTDANTYWLGIMALYNAEPNFAWGWETRPHFYNDDAVRFFGKPEPDTNYPADMFEPVEFDGNGWDLSFELIYDPNCYRDQPDYSEWLSVGKPPSWCYPRQCRGDCDNTMEGSPFTGYYYVGIDCLQALIDAWKVPEPPHGPGITIDQLRVDFSHSKEGGPFTGYYRVGIDDLTILIANWKLLEPPDGPGIPAECLH